MMGEMKRIWSTSGAHVESTVVAIPALAPRLILFLPLHLLLLAGPSASVVYFRCHGLVFFAKHEKDAPSVIQGQCTSAAQSYNIRHYF
ncbi:hypothetical protein Vadar_020880 [Vaccinium darrowii]|uniref:Uncharacterized protein n=1 Tax=Vaccinium darrowii TaxID=229202 RepID=A0ACB7X2Q4_9ERIC|nr:hypothetical protein Vadar_020880 [Vaccinium darrowii]